MTPIPLKLRLLAEVLLAYSVVYGRADHEERKRFMTLSFDSFVIVNSILYMPLVQANGYHSSLY
jgi:hypothetical protein